MKRIWLYAFAGGLAFWMPDIVAKASGAVGFRDARVLSIVCPAVLLVIYSLLKLKTSENKQWTVPLWMLIGVWILGPTIMSITSAIRGASWAHPPNEWLGNFLVFAIATVFPPLTFIYSAYDGTLVALVIATIIFGAEIGRQRILTLKRLDGMLKK